MRKATRTAKQYAARKLRNLFELEGSEEDNSWENAVLGKTVDQLQNPAALRNNNRQPRVGFMNTKVGKVAAVGATLLAVEGARSYFEMAKKLPKPTIIHETVLKQIQPPRIVGIHFDEPIRVEQVTAATSVSVERRSRAELKGRIPGVDWHANWHLSPWQRDTRSRQGDVTTSFFVAPEAVKYSVYDRQSKTLSLTVDPDMNVPIAGKKGDYRKGVFTEVTATTQDYAEGQGMALSSVRSKDNDSQASRIGAVGRNSATPGLDNLADSWLLLRGSSKGCLDKGLEAYPLETAIGRAVAKWAMIDSSINIKEVDIHMTSQFDASFADRRINDFKKGVYGDNNDRQKIKLHVPEKLDCSVDPTISSPSTDGIKVVISPTPFKVYGPAVPKAGI